MSVTSRVGTIEGIESATQSIGLGQRDVTVHELPRVGARFTFDAGDERIQTSPVQRLRWIDENEVRFMTRNTTYILRLRAANA